MPKLARLYLDTARLGLMSPGAQLAARDFARLAGEGVSTLYFQKLLRGTVSPAKERPAWPGLAAWDGVEGVKARIRELLRLPTSAPVLLAGRTTTLMRWAARQLWNRCRRILIPDTAWPPYARILEEERLRSGGVAVPISIRDLVQCGQIDSGGLISRLIQAYTRHGCDGLFLAAVSHDGVRIPTAPLLTALRCRARVRLAVIDGAQELAPFGSVDRDPNYVTSLCEKNLRRDENLGCSRGCRNDSRPLAPTDLDWHPTTVWIAESWSRLPPYIREAIGTLVAAGLKEHGFG